MMANRMKIVFLFLLALMIAAPQVPVFKQLLSVETAHAQKKQRKSLFDFIRERRKKRQEKLREKVRRQSGIVRPEKKVRRKKTNRTTSSNSDSTTEPARQPPKPEEPVEIVEKSENAAKLLVVGDFIAGGIARQLERLYQANPNIVVVSKTSAASGIVRYDVVNWEEEIPALIQEHKPVVVVTLLGMNDRQAMRLPSGRVKEMTGRWMQAYTRRVSKIAGFSTEYKLPMVWVGLPPVRFSKMNTDYLTFNEVYRSSVEAVGGQFVDVWDGFTNQEGKFVSAGPDVNGQIVRLRGSRGINMTKAGYRKLAFYVDKELRKFGISADPTKLQLTSLDSFSPLPNQPSRPQYNPAKTKTTVVISLGPANPNNPEPLAGEKGFLTNDEDKIKSVSYELVEKGIVIEPQSGRIDAGWGTPKIAEHAEEFEALPGGIEQAKPQAANDNTPADDNNSASTAQ